MKRQALLNSFISWGGGTLALRPGDGGEWKTEGGTQEGGRKKQCPGITYFLQAQRGPDSAMGAGEAAESAGGRHVCSTWSAGSARVIDGARRRALLTQSHCSPSVKCSCRPLLSSWTFVQIPENRSWRATGKFRAVEGEEKGRADHGEAPCSPRPWGNVGKWRLGHTDPKCLSSLTG